MLQKQNKDENTTTCVATNLFTNVPPTDLNCSKLIINNVNNFCNKNEKNLLPEQNTPKSNNLNIQARLPVLTDQNQQSIDFIQAIIASNTCKQNQHQHSQLIEQQNYQLLLEQNFLKEYQQQLNFRNLNACNPLLQNFGSSLALQSQSSFPSILPTVMPTILDNDTIKNITENLSNNLISNQNNPYQILMPQPTKPNTDLVTKLMTSTSSTITPSILQTYINSQQTCVESQQKSVLIDEYKDCEKESTKRILSTKFNLPAAKTLVRISR